MTKRKLDPPRKLKQSSLLDGFPKSGRQGISLNGGMNTFEDDDPYKFEGSQSLEVRDYKVSFQPHGHGGSKAPQTGRKSSSSNLQTPQVQLSGTAKQRNKKIKRSPATLTKNERLKAQEEQDLQCALEASRQDAERKDRKRKRDQQNHPNRGGEGEEGERGEHSHLQKHIKKTTETSSVTTSARSPSSSRPPLTSPPLTLPPLTLPPLTSPPLTSPPLTSPPLTSPPLTSPLGPATPEHVHSGSVSTMVSGCCGGGSSTAEAGVSPGQPAARITTLPSSQLKSVSIKKLSVKKSDLTTTRLSSLAGSVHTPHTSQDVGKKSDKLTLCGVSVNRTPIVINADETISKHAERSVEGEDTMQEGGGGGGEESGTTTPVLDKASEPNSRRISTSLQTNSSRHLAEVVTPPLSSSLPRLPPGRMTRVSGKEPSRPPRRKLALSYSRKRVALSACVCDETVEIMSVSNGPVASPVNGYDVDLANTTGDGRSGDPAVDHITAAAPCDDDVPTQHNQDDHLTPLLGRTANGVDHVTISPDDAGDHVMLSPDDHVMSHDDAMDHVILSSDDAMDHVTLDAGGHVTLPDDDGDHVTDHDGDHVTDHTSTAIINDGDHMILSPDHKAKEGEDHVTDHRDKGGDHVTPSPGLAAHGTVTTPPGHMDAGDDHMISALPAVLKKRRLSLGLGEHSKRIRLSCHQIPPPAQGTGTSCEPKEDLEEVKVRSPPPRIKLSHRILPPAKGTGEPPKMKGDLEEVKVRSPLTLRHRVPKGTRTSYESPKVKEDLEEVKVRSPLTLRHRVPRTFCEPSKVKGDLEEVKVRSTPQLSHQILSPAKSTGTSCGLSKVKGDLEEVKVRSPPPVYADGNVSPADYTKVILGRFDSYFCQLAKAQSQVLTRVQWGKPISSGRKSRSRKNKSPHSLDNRIKYSLKIISPATVGLTANTTTGHVADHDDIGRPTECEAIGSTIGRPNDCEAIGHPNDYDAIGHPNDCEAIGSPTDIGRPNDYDAIGCPNDSATEGHAPVCDEVSDDNAEVSRSGYLSGWEMSGGRNDYSSDSNAEQPCSPRHQSLPNQHFQGSVDMWAGSETCGSRAGHSRDAETDSNPGPAPHATILISMQCSPASVNDWHVDRRGSHLKSRAIASASPDIDDNMFARNSAPRPSPFDRDLSPIIARCDDGGTSDVLEQGEWLSSKKPPLSAKKRKTKTPNGARLATPTVKKKTPRGTARGGKGGRGRRDKGTAAGRLLRNMCNTRSDDEEPETSLRGGDHSSEGLRERDHSSGGLRERDHSSEGLRERDHSSGGLRERDHRSEGLRERDHRSGGLRERDHSSEGLRERLGGDGGDSSGSEIITSQYNNKRRRKRARVSSNSSEGSSDDEAGKCPMGTRKQSSFVSPLVRGYSRGVSTPRRPDVIDLTEECRQQNSTMDDGPSTKLPCPVCNCLFEDTEIQLHANQCLKMSTRATGGVVSSDGDYMPVRTLRKRLLTSKGAKGVGQGGPSTKGAGQGAPSAKGAGQGGSSAKGAGQGGPSAKGVGEGKTPAKRAGQRRPTAKGAGQGTSKMPQRTLTDFQAAEKVTENDVIDLDDLTPVRPPSPMDTDTPSSQSDHLEQRDSSYDNPRAIRCEDGGYLIDPSTISSSPIRSFKRIDDLAPEQRAGFQNQFQGKKGGRRRTSRGGQVAYQGATSWTGRDDFDELLGNSSSNQDFPRRYQGRKSGGGKKYWRRKKKGQRH